MFGPKTKGDSQNLGKAAPNKLYKLYVFSLTRNLRRFTDVLLGEK